MGSKTTSLAIVMTCVLVLTCGERVREDVEPEVPSDTVSSEPRIVERPRTGGEP